MSICGKDEDGLVSKYLNRKISIRISSFILSRWSDPNPYIATTFSFFVGLLSGFTYLLGLNVLGGIFFQFASILDGVDGELARATGKAGPLGAFIDTILDRIIDSLVLISIFYISFIRYSSGLFREILYIICLFAWFMVSYYHSVIRYVDSGGLVHGGVSRFASRDVRIFVVFIFSLFGSAIYGVYIAGMLSIIYLVVSIPYTTKLLRINL